MATVFVDPIKRRDPQSAPGVQKPAAVKLVAVERRFQGRTVIEQLDLTLYAGEFVALLGASGSGKTTLLRMLAGLDAPDAGEVWVPPARTVVFQEPRLLPSRRVWRNVVLGLKGSEYSRTRAIASLEEVGLSTLAEAWPATLSGGEAQRVALARALVRQPKLLLLDEPFAALDALTRLKMQQLIGELVQLHGPATLLVTHDVEEAILLADRILVLRGGRVSCDSQVHLPRPRISGEAPFNELRTALLRELGVR